MPIIQGGNTPIKITFDEQIVDVPDISIGLFTTHGKSIKLWRKDDVSISEDGYEVSCPLTQEETASFTSGNIVLEVKMINSKGTVVFYDRVKTTVKNRYDKVVTL